MRYVVTIGGKHFTIELEENGHLRHLSLNERGLSIDWRLVGRERPAATRATDPSPDQYSLLIGENSYSAYVRSVEEDVNNESSGSVFEVFIQGQPYVVNVQDARSQALASLAGGSHAAGEVTIRAPMPGLVSNVLVAVGDEVQRGQTIAILEAMKMENDLTTPRTGRVRAIHVVKGQTVAQNEVLAVVGDAEESPPTIDDSDE